MKRTLISLAVLAAAAARRPPESWAADGLPIANRMGMPGHVHERVAELHIEHDRRVLLRGQWPR